MENFDNKNNKIHRVPAPQGMYAQVRERIIQERMRAAKNRRQLAIGSALLLLIGVLNVVIILFYQDKIAPQKTTNQSVEQTIFDTYFDHQNALSK